MSDKLRESLSALMDDEANELELQRLLAQIGEDEEMLQRRQSVKAMVRPP